MATRPTFTRRHDHERRCVHSTNQFHDQDSRRIEVAREPNFWGAPGRIRTCDARLRSPALYPLSYEGGGNRQMRSLWLVAKAMLLDTRRPGTWSRGRSQFGDRPLWWVKLAEVERGVVDEEGRDQRRVLGAGPLQRDALPGVRRQV